VEGGNRGIVQIFLTLGENPFYINNLGETPLHLAAKHGFDNIVEDLLEAVAPEEIRDYVDTKNNKGETALYYAEYKGYKRHKNIAQRLLTLGSETCVPAANSIADYF